MSAHRQHIAKTALALRRAVKTLDVVYKTGLQVKRTEVAYMYLYEVRLENGPTTYSACTDSVLCHQPIVKAHCNKIMSLNMVNNKLTTVMLYGTWRVKQHCVRTVLGGHPFFRQKVFPLVGTKHIVTDS